MDRTVPVYSCQVPKNLIIVIRSDILIEQIEDGVLKFTVST